MERREAQRARSRRFAQADCPVARAAPEARASGNIRPRGAATTLAPPGAALPASVGEEFLSVAFLSVAWANLGRAGAPRERKCSPHFGKVSMTQLGRRFRLSDMPGSGISCGKDGAFVGEVPLLERPRGPHGSEQWQPRRMADLNRDLSKRYDLPVEFNTKIAGLTAVARALDRGDLFHAQIATLHLQIPDPPALTKTAQSMSEIADLARQLRSSGLLKADWDPAKHPRWPAESPGSIGGEFAPAGSASSDSAAGNERAPLLPIQLTIPVPFELPGGISFPSEILPPPLLPPNINPLTIPRNPYPGRPKCVREWAEATQDCLDLWADGQLGTDDYRGMGKTLHECIIGRVSEDCGGNRLDA